MNFTIVNHDQRSPEWFQARCGRLTGSVAAQMLDFTQKGTDGYKRRDLRASLICERLTGRPQEDTYINAVMQRGIDLEPEAFAAYEAHTGNLVRRTGFVAHNIHLVGCSLDGDVDDFTGIVEIKCPKSATHLSYIESKGLPDNHRSQVLHNMWVTGAQWCDFASFDDRFPEGLQLFVVRLERTPALQIEINAYEKMALEFLKQIDDKVNLLRGAVAA
jgi:putative phage-type endonuclease